jgi:hypothetical protein
LHAPAFTGNETFPGVASSRKQVTVSAANETCYALRAFGLASAPADQIDGLRQKPGPSLKHRISPVLLKYSDEQTVMALSAVLDAAHRFGLQDTDFGNWGAIAAPCRLGRPKLAGALTRFVRDGVRGASPMIVPHLSLHAVSGTISQALHVHGANFGVSSGAEHVSEGLMAAVAVLSEIELPALWLVLTSWDSEFVPDEQGRCLAVGETSPVCRGVALALSRAAINEPGPRLRILPASNVLAVTKHSSPVTPVTALSGLAAFLTGKAGRTWVCPLPVGGWVELTGIIPSGSTETRP